MIVDQWTEFWRVGRTGFHQSEVHPLLIEHGSWLLEGASRVGVPLCGKSLDLCWLAARVEVIGFELVSQAIEEFMTEQGVSLESEEYGDRRWWKTAGLGILQGDFMQVSLDDIGSLQAIWDRAAMVAIRPEGRERYAAKLVELLESGGRILLVTWDADRPADVGPPYRLRATDVNDLYQSYGTVEQMASIVETPETSERVAAKGLSWVRTEVFRITLK